MINDLREFLNDSTGVTIDKLVSITELFNAYNIWADKNNKAIYTNRHLFSQEVDKASKYNSTCRGGVYMAPCCEKKVGVK